MLPWSATPLNVDSSRRERRWMDAALRSAPLHRPVSRALGLLLAAPTCLFCGSPAHAATFAPPPGKVWHALSGANPSSYYQRRVDEHVAVRGNFIRWGGGYEWAIRKADANRSRLLLHVSTASGQHRPEAISPGAIARGRGDGFLVSFNGRMAQHGRPVYLRWLGEMNNCDNAYSSRNCTGSPRNSEHSPASFKQAWRRAVLIVRGGEVATIDRQLASLGMPPVDTDAVALPTPQVAFIWSPMTGGSPMIPALRPGVFWPGAQYVDWVGTSFYSRYPNFRFLTPYYRRFAARYRKPFAFVEWAMWGGESPAFVRSFFTWVRNHSRTKMISYNQGGLANGPFVLARYPRSAAAIRRKVSSARFLAWAPEWR
jgi:hypothetical protein